MVTILTLGVAIRLTARAVVKVPLVCSRMSSVARSAATGPVLVTGAGGTELIFSEVLLDFPLDDTLLGFIAAHVIQQLLKKVR